MTPESDLDEAPAALRPAPSRALRSGTRLRDYEITGLVGEGPGSIVYVAWDHSLQRQVAVKEFMPSAMVSRLGGSAAVVVASDRHAEAFRAGLKSFLDEARLLARYDHPSLVKVYRFWEDNGTAYTVMPYHEGPTLKKALADLGHVPGEAELRAWLKPILNALTVLHEGGTWHQNIGPDEIVLTPVGPVLLGFGAARHAAVAAAADPAAASSLKPGYAAIEQYGSEAATLRGPWTDCYALAAVVYGAIAGFEPAPAPERLADDDLQPLGQVAAGLYSPGFLAAIDAALAVQPERRPRDHAEFRALMGDIEAPAPVSLTPRRDLMQEPFLGDGAGQREITVPDRPLLSLPVEPTEPQPPLGDEARARLATAMSPVPAPMAASGRAAPSWMQAGAAPKPPARRWLQGALGAAAVLAVGLTAGPQLVGRTTATAPTSPPAAPRAASAPASPLAAASVATPPASAPRVLATATASSAAGRVASPAAAAASVPVAAPTSPVTVASPATPAERQARCLGILQKASLEPISAAETEFFKSECK